MKFLFSSLPWYIPLYLDFQVDISPGLGYSGRNQRLGQSLQLFESRQCLLRGEWTVLDVQRLQADYLVQFFGPGV